MTYRFMQIFSLQISLHKLCKNMGFHLPYSHVSGQNLRLYPCTAEYGSVKTRILAYFIQCILQTIILTNIYQIFCSICDVSSNQIINLGSCPQIEALQIRRSITTSSISKLSFMNADTHTIFLK